MQIHDMQVVQVEDYFAALRENEQERVIGLVNAELAKHPECKGCRVDWFGVFILTGGCARACRDTVFLPVVREIVDRHRTEPERDG